MTNLIRWQTHRYVLRQSVAYFANDFAGRIASNIIQAGASLQRTRWCRSSTRCGS